MGALNLLANLGLILFLLLMGLELDLGTVAKRARTSLTISLTGIIGTFALSIGVSKFFYENIPGLEEQTSYTSFLLFIGVAMSVTALPVLARILTERKLLKTPVGVTVISAAAVDDATGWSFLALVVSLVSASSPVTIVYIVLGAIGFALFQFLVMRRVFRYLLHRFSGAEGEKGDQLPEGFVLIAFIWTLVSAFYTEAIGIHAIFGAFLTGLILPRENGFAIRLTERLEELVTVLLLPLYFTYSGLRTNIGSMNDGLSWGCFFLVLGTVMVGKIVGCTLAARVMKNTWRESLTIGCLMNTKGLVELIILNIGLDAGVLNTQTFAIMVLLAIATTVMTTPLVAWLYPSSYYTTHALPSENDFIRDQEHLLHPLKHDLSVVACVPDISSVTSLMTFLTFLSPTQTPTTTPTPEKGKTNLHILRLLPLTDRMSSLLIAANHEDAVQRDPAVNVFRTFANLRGVDIGTDVCLSAGGEWGRDVSGWCYERGMEFVVVPWGVGPNYYKTNGNGGGEEPPRSPGTPPPSGTSLWSGWFGGMPGVGYGGDGEGDEGFVNDLAYQLLKKCRVKVGIFVDRGFEVPGAAAGRKHVLVPFFGGPDDRECVLVALRMAGGDAVVHFVVFRTLVGEGDGEVAPLDPDDETLLEFVKGLSEGTVGGSSGGSGTLSKGKSKAESMISKKGSIRSRSSVDLKDKADSEGSSPGADGAGSSYRRVSTNPSPSSESPTSLKDLPDPSTTSGTAVNSDTTPPTTEPNITLTTIHTRTPVESVLAELSKRDYALTICGHFGPGWSKMINKHAGNVLVGTNEAANAKTVYIPHAGDVGLPLARTATRL
ncbi:K(+)/H(+) antiporter, partial [Rhizophlyctis rosea]